MNNIITRDVFRAPGIFMEELESDFEVFYPDRALFFSQRAKEAQENWCQLLLSLHLNSGPLNAKGCELCYQAEARKERSFLFVLKIPFPSFRF